MVSGRSMIPSAALAFCLAGCGGGGGGEGVASTPPPPVAAPPASGGSVSPAPTPTPTPAPAPTPTPPATAQVATIFPGPLYNPLLAVAGKGWQFDHVPNVTGAHDVRDADSFSASYDQASGSYRISAPVAGSGTLYRVGGLDPDIIGTSFAAAVADSATAATGSAASMRILSSDQPASRYSYTSYAYLYADAPAERGMRTIAYGAFGIAQPTRPGDVPTTGSARYNGDVIGHFAGDAGATWLSGIARFDFDFARAALNGDMTLNVQCFMGCSFNSVNYLLADTHFTRGDTRFGGNLALAGQPPTGSFSGLFAGPGAVELMSAFRLSFFNPVYGQTMDAGGVILGKRQ